MPAQRRAVLAACALVHAGCASLFVDLDGFVCEGAQCSDAFAPPPNGPDAGIALADAGADASASPEGGLRPDGATDDGRSVPAVRAAKGLVAFYDFEEMSGAIAHDTSGVMPALDLQIESGAPATHVWGSPGLRLTSASRVVSSGAATKIIARCKATNEVTLELFIAPLNAGPGTARVAGVGSGDGTANVSIRAEASAYVGYLSNKPIKAPSTVKTLATHIVLTKGPGARRAIYVDGVEIAADAVGEDVTGWNETQPLTLAADPTGAIPWTGILYHVAFYDRAFTSADVVEVYKLNP